MGSGILFPHVQIVVDLAEVRWRHLFGQGAEVTPAVGSGFTVVSFVFFQLCRWSYQFREYLLEMRWQGIGIVCHFPVLPVRRQGEISPAEREGIRFQVSVVQADVLHQLVEGDVGPEDVRVTRQQQLLAGASQCHIQLAVNQEIALLKRIGRKEVELAEILYGKRIDDNVALAALVAFHRVDGDVLQSRQLEARNLFSYHGNLVAVGHDDTYRPVRVETGFRQTVNMA